MTESRRPSCSSSEPRPRLRDVAEGVDRGHRLLDLRPELCRGGRHELGHGGRAAGDQHERAEPRLHTREDRAGSRARAPAHETQSVRSTSARSVSRSTARRTATTSRTSSALCQRSRSSPPVAAGRLRAGRRGGDGERHGAPGGEPERRPDHRVSRAAGAVDVHDRRPARACRAGRPGRRRPCRRPPCTRRRERRSGSRRRRHRGRSFRAARLAS